MDKDRSVDMDSVLSEWLKLIPIENCIDIGGGGGTSWLVRNLPQVPHYLIDIKLETGELSQYREHGISATYHQLDASKGIDSLGLHALSHYFLKIDVDGPEIDVIVNSPKTVANAAMIVCEATTWTISQRLVAIESTGKRLVEIGAPCFYCRRLWQVELVFVREDLLPGWALTPHKTCELMHYQDEP